jgi:protein O-mannosyl-transferase
VVVIARYLWLLVWPRTLSSDYSYSQIPLFTGRFMEWAALAIVAAAAAGGVWLWRRDRRAFFWAGFAGLTLLPAANLLFASGTIMAERVMYLPSLGVIAVVAEVLNKVAQGFSVATDRRTEVLRHLGLVIVCAAVAGLAVRTWVRNQDWHDDITLWTSAVEASPRSFKAHRGLAEALYDADPTHANIDRVVAEIERGVAGLDGLPDSQNDARTYRQGGAYRMEQGDVIGLSPEARMAYTRAEALLTRSIRIIEAHASTVPAADAYRLLSAVDVRLQKNDAAIDAATRARTLDPLNAIGYRQAAAAYVRANRADDAAVVLMTGSLVTSDRSLRDELVDLYKSGLDPLGCALVQAPNGPAIDPSCATVRRHACAAVREALQVHERTDRPDLAQRLKDGAARQFHCE